MPNASVIGTVHLIEPTKTYGQKGFRKRLVVLEIDDGGRFTNYVPLEFTQDNCDQADELNEGDEIEALYLLKGRNWQRDANAEVKWFLSAECYRFDVLKVSGTKVKHSSEDLEEEAAECDDEDVPF